MSSRGDDASDEGSSSAVTSVLAQIVAWSSDRPLWQQDALRRLAAGELSDDDLRELTTLCEASQADEGEGSEGQLQPVPLRVEHATFEAAGQPVGQLHAIRDCVDVDALAPGQELAFALEGLTIVYGDNGSGKSSYTRLLRQFSRGAGAPESVEGNAFAAGGDARQATIDYSEGEQSQSYVWPIDGEPPEILRTVRVFDASGVHALVQEGTVVTYEPGGLHLLSELVEVCGKVRTRLEQEQASLKREADKVADQLESLDGHHEVGHHVAQLVEVSAMQALRDLCADAAVHDRLTQLQEELGRLRPADPSQTARRLRADAERAGRLANRLERLSAALGDPALDELESLAARVRSTREAAKQAAAILAGEPLSGTGGDVWRQMWEAARAYSSEYAYPDASFPVTSQDALCVLCQQPLGPEGRDRLDRFERFVQDSVQAQADEAIQNANQRLQSIQVEALEEAGDENLAEDPLLDEDELGSAVVGQLVALKARHTWAVMMLRDALADQEEAVERPSHHRLDETIIRRLRQLKTSLEGQAAAVESPSDERIAELEAAIAEQQARVSLTQLFSTVEEQHMRLRRLQRIETAIRSCDTGQITRKHRELTNEVVSDQLVNRFDQERATLGLERLRVHLRPVGERGETKCVVELREAVRPLKATRLLSAGEHRGVALAAMLAELHVTGDRSPLVIDDPVSSLDHEIRNRLARRLADEAATRQVIVFTHDPVFVFLLHEEAKQASGTGEARCPVEICQIERTLEGTGCRRTIGSANPSPLPLTKRIGSLKQRWQTSKRAYEQHDEAVWRSAAKELVEELRECWERAVEEYLFNETVQRFQPSVQTSRLKQVPYTPADAAVVDRHMTALSYWVHDSPRALASVVPTPQELLDEIEALEQWRRDLDGRRKAR